MIVTEGQKIKPSTTLLRWDPHNVPIIAEVGGKVRSRDIIPAKRFAWRRMPAVRERWVIMEHKGDLHPQILIGMTGAVRCTLSTSPKVRTSKSVRETRLTAGTLLAKTPRGVSGTQDITGGLPRVTEIFEARRPKEPAVIAEISGTVEVSPDRSVVSESSPSRTNR